MWPNQLAQLMIDTTGATEPMSVGLLTLGGIALWIITVIGIPALAISLFMAGRRDRAAKSILSYGAPRSQRRQSNRKR